MVVSAFGNILFAHKCVILRVWHHDKDVISEDTVKDVKVSIEQILDDTDVFDNLKLQEINPKYKDFACVYIFMKF